MKQIGGRITKVTAMAVIIVGIVGTMSFASDTSIEGMEAEESTQVGPSVEDLFSLDVGIPLDDAELEDVEGEGLLGAIGGFIAGFMGGVNTAGAAYAVAETYRGFPGNELNVIDVMAAGLVGGVIGAIKFGLATGPL